MTNFLQNGIGGTTGDALAIASPLLLSGDVWYVSSVSGNSAYTGKDRLHPLDTLSAAVSAAASGDVIVLMEGHKETISTTITPGKRLHILGEGKVSGEPSAEITAGHASNDVINVNAANSSIRNVRFKPHSSAHSGSYITSNVRGVWLRDCYFEFDENNDGPGIDMQVSADNWRFDGCTFRVTEETVNASPDSAIRTAGAIAGMWLFDCIFDGGTVGFQDSSGNPWAFDGSAAAITGLHVENLSLLKGCDFKVHTDTVGYIHNGSATGSGRVIW